jgi:hypothetical protein
VGGARRGGIWCVLRHKEDPCYCQRATTRRSSVPAHQFNWIGRREIEKAVADMQEVLGHAKAAHEAATRLRGKGTLHLHVSRAHDAAWNALQASNGALGALESAIEDSNG